MFRHEITRPAFLTQYGDINNKSIVKMPVNKRVGLGDYEIVRPGMTEPPIMPRSFVGFDALREMDEEQFGVRVQLGDTTITKLLTISIPDPSDKSWLDEYQRRKDLGESDDDLKKSPPLGREQRKTNKDLQFGQRGNTPSENIAALEALIKQGFTESRDERIELGKRIAEVLGHQTRTRDEILDEMKRNTSDTMDALRDTNIRVGDVENLTRASINEIRDVSAQQKKDVLDILKAIDSKRISDADKKELYDEVTKIINTLPKNDPNIRGDIDQLLQDVASLANITKTEREALAKELIAKLDNISQWITKQDKTLFDLEQKLMIQIRTLPIETQIKVEESLRKQLDSIKDFSREQYDEMKKVLDTVSDQNESLLRRFESGEFNKVMEGVKKLELPKSFKESNIPHKLWTPEQVRSDNRVILWILSNAKNSEYPVMKTRGLEVPKPISKSSLDEWASSESSYIDYILDVPNFLLTSVSNAIKDAESGIDNGQIDGIPAQEFNARNTLAFLEYQKNMLSATAPPPYEEPDEKDQKQELTTDMLNDPQSYINELRAYFTQNPTDGLLRFFRSKGKLILTDIFKLEKSIDPNKWIDYAFDKINNEIMNGTFGKADTVSKIMTSIIENLRDDPEIGEMLTKLPKDGGRIKSNLYRAWNQSTWQSAQKKIKGVTLQDTPSDDIYFKNDNFTKTTALLWKLVLKDVINDSLRIVPQKLSFGLEGFGKRKRKKTRR
jgi:hypothetical protein